MDCLALVLSVGVRCGVASGWRRDGHRAAARGGACTIDRRRERGVVRERHGILLILWGESRGPGAQVALERGRRPITVNEVRRSRPDYGNRPSGCKGSMRLHAPDRVRSSSGGRFVDDADEGSDAVDLAPTGALRHRRQLVGAVPGAAHHRELRPPLLRAERLTGAADRAPQLHPDRPFPGPVRA
ncbi:hypothetical protein PLANTIT3_60415 [Plantibacter sp. T3]|nr:hypothetical protein PLANTIT3_60415 [Plantibacter sp. T3]